jgi:hypothetical protein
MEELILTLGIIALLICAYQFRRDYRRQKKDGFGRFRISDLAGLPIWIKPWAYYLLIIFIFSCLVVIIVIALVY